MAQQTTGPDIRRAIDSVSPGDAFIPVYRPSLAGNERRYVNECLDSTWISSKGRFIGAFEEAFARYIDVPEAIAVSNGTVALHLALLGLRIGPGDEVIVPTLTYIASVNAITYVGAHPVFVDSDRASWQLDPADVRRKVTDRTRAIMAVHLYGHPADMTAIRQVADEFGLMVIEDCAEGIGARLNGAHVGTMSDVATFSFFGNKTITTGEGGMVVTGNRELAERITRLKGQGLAPGRLYWHDMVGYNFRMTNICAAIGLAQLERIDDILARKRQIAQDYDSLLAGTALETCRAVTTSIDHGYWMYSVLVPAAVRDEVMRRMLEVGVETRPFFYPIHTMPMYRAASSFPVAERLAASGINLPSWPDLTTSQVGRVVDTLLHAIDAAS